jgi:hypothetical protein
MSAWTSGLIVVLFPARFDGADAAKTDSLSVADKFD